MLQKTRRGERAGPAHVQDAREALMEALASAGPAEELAAAARQEVLPVAHTPTLNGQRDALLRHGELRGRALAGGGAERVARQHKAGKMTARERLERLVDPGSFVEMDAYAVAQGTSRVPAGGEMGDAVVAGFGEVEGRPVAVYAQDFTVHGGSLGATTARKIVKILEQARLTGVPVVGLNDSGGARIQEGVASLGGYGDLFQSHIRNSGVVPQIAVALGPSAGGAVYGPALCDFIVMSRRSGLMFVTGPDVVKTVTGESCTFEDLGGADVHASESGVAHLVGEDDAEAIDLARRLLSYLPLNNLDEAPLAGGPDQPERDEAILNVVPADPKASYDVRDVVERTVDHGTFFELQPAYAPNLCIGLARLGGRTVGVVANQPRHLAGVLDVKASEKGARFIRFCDAFHIPVVTFVDVPGFLPGLTQEHGGIIRRGAKLLYAYGEATVPKLTVVLRKAYGGAYIVMGSKHLGADVNLSWPGSEIAVLGAEAATRILYKKRLEEPGSEGFREAIEKDYRTRLADPYHAAEMGFVDDVIHPAETRLHLLAHLRRLRGKRASMPERKHGNIPL